MIRPNASHDGHVRFSIRTEHRLGPQPLILAAAELLSQGQRVTRTGIEERVRFCIWDKGMSWVDYGHEPLGGNYDRHRSAAATYVRSFWPEFAEEVSC